MAQMYQFVDENNVTRLFAEIQPDPSVPGLSTFPDGSYFDIVWQVVSNADGTEFEMTDGAGHDVISIFGNGPFNLSPPSGTGHQLVLRDSANNPVIAIVDASHLGFFGSAPAAQPTGVAVSAAGIHAALVTLGLITA